jgi:hypothetical protein
MGGVAEGEQAGTAKCGNRSCSSKRNPRRDADIAGRAVTALTALFSGRCLDDA